MKNKWTDRLIGAGLGVMALAVYCMTLSSGAYPGQSADFIVRHADFLPRVSPAQPLWHFIVQLIIKIPIGGLVSRLNLFSALCGAVSIWFLYYLVARVVYNTIEIDSTNRVRAVIAARLAGISSALFLMFCLPFWFVSNKAHIASFDIMLLLGITGLFFRYAETGKMRWAFIFAFLYGVGIAEFSTLLIFLPLFGLILLFLLWRDECLHVLPITGIVLCGLAGISFYLITAWEFYGTLGYELRGYDSFWQITWFMWRDQYFLITRSLPKEGWMIILIETVIPWLACLCIARRALNDEKDWSYYFLHLLITCVAICLLLNVRLTPWRILGAGGGLLVTPYVLTASIFGYLIAYWYLLPAGWWPDDEEQWKLWFRKWFGFVITVPLIILACIALFRNFEEADARPAKTVNFFAREIVKSMPDREWLITDGVFDDHLLLAADEMGRNIRFLNLRSGGNEIYMKYVARLFDEPRLRNLAGIGMLSLLQEWFKSDKEIHRKIAIMTVPDLWEGSGFIAVPNMLVFYGVRDKGSLDAGKLLSSHEDFWAETVPALNTISSGRKGLPTGAERYIFRHISMIGNNLGVLMQDMAQREEDAETRGHGDAGKREDREQKAESRRQRAQELEAYAFKAYTRAREICPGNVSALLNLGTMLKSGFESDQAETILKALDDLSSGQNKNYHIWSLSRYYGYVRAPEAFARLGWNWALSGRPGMAVSGLKKAIDLLPGDKKAEAKQTLADFYLTHDQYRKSRSIYNELLAKDPENQRALLGLVRVSIKEKDFLQAKELLERVEKNGVERTQLALEWAILYEASGHVDQARIILEELVDIKPDFLQAWAMLAEILMLKSDDVALRRCVRHMRELEKGRGYYVCMLEARLALKNKDIAAARRYFGEAHVFRPNNTSVIEMLIRLDMTLKRMGDAGLNARKLLALDPENMLGNYVMGSVQLMRGEDELAEDSLRRSLETGRTPEALNDLAWLLQEKGKYQEAEKMAREAIDMNKKLHEAWDTLGVILMKQGKLDEADEKLEWTLSLTQDDPGVFVHMAQLKIRQGHKEQALELINILKDKRSQLSREDRRTIDSLQKELASGR
ncbi:tetratricopeptide repeat protein [Verrucomicrobiota bacterium]